MTRRTSTQTLRPIKGLHDLNDVILQIAARDRQLAKIKALTESTIDKVTKAAADQSEPLLKEIDELVIAAHSYVVNNRDVALEKGKKSRKLASGTIGFRNDAESVHVAKNHLKAVLSALKKRRLGKACIKLSESLNKKAILKNKEKLLDVEQISFQASERFFIKPDEVNTDHSILIEGLKK